MGNIAEVIGGKFNAADIEPAAPMDTLPAGTYVVEITAADVKPLKSGNGTGLQVEFTVIDGPYSKRRIWSNYNLQHSSPDAERIGRSQLAALCNAAGVGELDDASDLAARTLQIKTKVKRQDGFADKAEVVAYEPAAGAPAPAAKPAAATPANKPAMPWKK